MAIEKFEVDKFDGQSSFGLWHNKMRALLWQQGLVKVLDEGLLDEPSSSTKEDDEMVHNVMWQRDCYWSLEETWEYEGTHTFLTFRLI